MNDNIIFGTDGWRALLDSEINHQTVKLVAQAFADYINSKNASSKECKVAVAFDGRKYSNEFAEIFSQVLSGNSILTFLSDKIIPTPALSYFVKANSLDAGVMITASHNPPIYNGIKFKASYGGPFVTEETLKVEKLLNKNAVKSSNDKICKTDFLPIYYRQLEEYIDFKSIQDSGLNILVDSMSGAGQRYLEELLKRHGCSATTIFSQIHEEFSGRSPEPIEKNLIPLKNFLIENPGFSFAAATDGDADRCGIMLEDGRWLSAQYTILLLNDYFVNCKHISGGLVKTSSVTDKIKLFESPARKVYDVQVGFKYICEKMTSEDIAIGCEESGGFGYKNHIPERDGLLSTLLMAEMLAKSGYSKLSDYFEEKEKIFGQIFYDRIDYKYEFNDRMSKLPDLFKNPPKEICSLKVTGISEFYSSRNIINGLKFNLLGNSRWLLLRSSETEPLIRIYSEGNSNSEVKELLQAGIDIVLNKKA
ncbi:MAG: phosphoglucomutase [Bacteroidota bacterium]|nr:phosphoglucomutase [Bacteroidota bacterium]